VSIQSFVKPGEFEPEAIAVMSEAFEAACKDLQDTASLKWCWKSSPSELLQRQELASVTRLACGQPRLLGCQAKKTAYKSPAVVAQCAADAGMRPREGRGLRTAGEENRAHCQHRLRFRTTRKWAAGATSATCKTTEPQRWPVSPRLR